MHIELYFYLSEKKHLQNKCKHLFRQKDTESVILEDYMKSIYLT